MKNGTKIQIRGRDYFAFCNGKPEHRQGERKLVALYNEDGRLVWGKAQKV